MKIQNTPCSSKVSKLVPTEYKSKALQRDSAGFNPQLPKYGHNYFYGFIKT